MILELTRKREIVSYFLICLLKFDGNFIFNLIFILIFNLIFGGPWGAQGFIKISPGGPGLKKKLGREILKNSILGTEVSTIFGISIFRFFPKN